MALSVVLVACEDDVVAGDGRAEQEQGSGQCGGSPPFRTHPAVDVEACRWTAPAESVLGVGDLVVTAAQVDGAGDLAEFVVAGRAPASGEALWETKPITVVVDEPRSLTTVTWEGEPYVMFSYADEDGAAALFVPLNGDDRPLTTWRAGDAETMLSAPLTDGDGVAVAFRPGTVPAEIEVIDPRTAETVALPSTERTATGPSGDGWYAEGTTDDRGFTVRRFDGSAVWQSADRVPTGADPAKRQVVLAAHDEYTVARWAKAGEPSAAMIAVHASDGTVLMTGDFGEDGDGRGEADHPRVVASPDRTRLVVRTEEPAAAVQLDLADGTVTPFDGTLTPVSLTDDGDVFAVAGDGRPANVSASGAITWTDESDAMVPATVVGGTAVVGGWDSPSLVEDRPDRTETAWAFPFGGDESDDQTRYAALANRFAPLVYLADHDGNGPAAASDFIASSELKWSHDSDCADHTITADVEEYGLGQGDYAHPAGGKPRSRTSRDCPHEGDPITSDTSVESPSALGPEGFFLDLDDSLRREIDDRHRTEGATAAPVYWQYEDRDDEPGGEGAIVYWLFYAFNDYLNVHEGDWERVAVLVDGDTPTGMTYWGHEGSCRASWDQVAKSAGRPVAYSAFRSHASYARAGNHRHPGGVDVTSHGARWTTWEHPEPLTAQRWWGYSGAWGAGGPKHFRGPVGPYPERNVDAAFTSGPCDLRSELDERYLGSWKSVGDVSQPSSPTSYQATLTLWAGRKSEEVGESHYPGLGCTGTLVLEAVDASGIVVTEKITDDPGNTCIKEVRIRLSHDGERLAYEVTGGSNTTATLERQP